MIMDEIDSGLGSRLGTSVGRMLRSMASSQILCISHLAQVRPLVRLHSLCMLASRHRGHAKQTNLCIVFVLELLIESIAWHVFRPGI